MPLECVVIAGMALLPVTSVDFGTPALLNIDYIESISSTTWRGNKIALRTASRSYASKLPLEGLTETLAACKAQLSQPKEANHD